MNAIQLHTELGLHYEALRRKLERLHDRPAEETETDTPMPQKTDCLPVLSAAAPPQTNSVAAIPPPPPSPPPAPPPPPPPTSRPAAERREATRRKGNPVPVELCNPRSTSPSSQGWVIDRSIGGLCLLVDEPQEEGTILSVRPAKAHAGFRWLQVEVKNCRQERASWNLGCQFVQKVGWDELRLFG